MSTTEIPFIIIPDGFGAADNLLVRDGTTEIVLADFGAAQQIPHDHAPPNRFPTGSPAHWSPEKAASEGHGFPSDLWASACVLIHMLSGSPPWIRRYPDAAILNFIVSCFHCPCFIGLAFTHSVSVEMR